MSIFNVNSDIELVEFQIRMYFLFGNTQDTVWRSWSKQNSYLTPKFQCRTTVILVYLRRIII